MNAFDDFLQQRLAERERQNLLRTLKPRGSAVDFYSNDYLGLAQSEELAKMISRKHVELGYGNGSTGSRLLGGNYPLIEETEDKLRKIFKAERCLIFNSGYNANLAVLSSVPGRGDTIVYDSLAHASLKDGARLSLARHHAFRHNDPEDLERKLIAAKGKKFIVLESVYSMDGDTAALHDFIQVARRHNAFIILDEAHSTGVIGNKGSGYAVDLGLESDIAIRIYTFGKAMGVHGACVAGSSTLTQYLINFSRPFIYTTAPSPHQVLSIAMAFDYLANHNDLQKTLQSKVERYLRRIDPGVSAAGGDGPIQTVIYPGNEEVKHLSLQLLKQGLDVRPILSPTVAEGSERLRICLHTFNSDSDIDRLANTINDLILAS